MTDINSKLTNILNTKNQIKQTLIDNGATDVTDVFSTYPNKIQEAINTAASGQGYTWPDFFEIKTRNGMYLDYAFYKQTLNSSTVSKIMEHKEIFKNAYSCSNMFGQCTFSIPNILYPTISMTDIDCKCADMSYMFTDVKFTYYGKYVTLDMSGIKTSINLLNISGMFDGSYFYKIDLTGIYTGKVTNMNSMFSYCSYLEEVIGDLDCSSLRNGLYPSSYSNPFYNCKKLRKVSLKNIYASCTIDNNSKFSINLAGTVLDHDSCLQIINELPTLPVGYTNIVLTLPTTNDVTDEERAIATGKNWTVVN